MPTNTLPLILSADNQHFLLDADFIIENAPQKSFYSFFYIGDRHATVQYFATYFRTGIFTENFDDAMSQIFKIAETNARIPDVILIDTPINKSKLEAFSFLIKHTPVLSGIPIIYNDRHLDNDLVYDFVSNDLIDEATNINSWDINFANKVKFMSNLKTQREKAILSTSVNHFLSNDNQKINALIKRVFDIVISTLLLILFSPIFLIIAIAIKLESKGSVFYNAPRAGRGFQVFTFFKFRTMEVDADKKITEVEHLNQYNKDKSGVRFLKICNDPRITKVGKFLRNTSLDELPQLLNVLIGDMSLVGNRPLPIYEAATLTTNESVERFMAPAGITGLWQIEKRSNEKMSVEERVNLDIKYARNHSFTYDMFILAKTPLALFQKTNV